MKFLWVVWLLFVTACVNKETAYRNMYEGLKKREEIAHPTAQTNKSAEPSVSYDQYQAERNKLLEKDVPQ